MADAETNSVIDLTDDSFTFIDHCNIANIVIELEDSINETPVTNRTNLVKRRSSNRKKYAPIQKEKPKQNDKIGKNKTSRFGDCPICFDELGENPLASTKCGHIFCLRCLERALWMEKRCPTCRTTLRGSSAYHPLYV